MHEITMMTYNVKYFGQGTKGVTTTEKTLDKIARAIAELDPIPEIITLQEVESHSLRADIGRKREKAQLDRLLERLDAQMVRLGQSRRYQGQYFPSHRYRITPKHTLYSTGLAVLYSDRFVLDGEPVAEDITHRRIKATAKLKQTRICAHVPLRHRDSGATLDLFTTHLSLPQFLTWRSIAFTRRMGYGQNQLLELYDALDFVARNQRNTHTLLTGDFNSLPDSLVYQHVVEDTHLVDPLRQAMAFTTESYRSYPSAGFMKMRMHLDYVFSSPSLKWESFDETRAYGSPSPFHGLSDHSPIIGRFSIQ